MLKSLRVWGLPSLVFLLVCCQAAHAVAVTVDVTVKAVYPLSGAIKVAYKTSAGEKAVELDVSPKAEITINGKTGTLDAVKPEQKAKIVYDKALKAITKIDATGAGIIVLPTFLRFTLQLSEFGDGKFRVEKTSKPAADDFSGTPFKFSNWPHTKATKGKDGMFRLVHDFKDADDPAALSFNESNLSVDKKSGTLVFTPRPTSAGKSPQLAAFHYAKKLRLPITVVCDVVKHNGGFFAILLSDRPTAKLGLLQCKLWSTDTDPDSSFDVGLTWFEFNDAGGIPADPKKRKMTTFFDEKAVEADEPFEQEFRLPLPKVKIDNTFTLDLNKLMGDGPTTIARLEVRGRLAPMFGFELKEKDGVVFANSIIPKSLAEKAGFQSGDVLAAINGKKPKNVTEASRILGNLQIGDEVVFTIQRADKTQELRVIAE